MITKFAPKDLVKPDDVTRMTGFKLPCQASGTNLTWTWKHNDSEITYFYGRPFSLLEDGTLVGQFLSSKQGGTYQCFVKDEETGVEIFSRKLQVAVTGKLLHNRLNRLIRARFFPNLSRDKVPLQGLTFKKVGE